MTETQLIKQFKIYKYGKDGGRVFSAKRLVDDYGVRIRRTKDSKKFGAWEIATTYFYSSQQGTVSLVRDLSEFAEANGYSVTVLKVWNGAEIEDLSPDDLSYAMRSWPANSWASIFVRLDEKE